MLFWFPRKKKNFVNPATSLNIIYIYENYASNFLVNFFIIDV